MRACARWSSPNWMRRSTILQHMPALADGAFDDPRTTLVVGDARDFVDATLHNGNRFDVVIFDLTEADGEAAPLHDRAFFAKSPRDTLATGGIALQLGAPWFEAAPGTVHARCPALGIRFGSAFDNVRPSVRHAVGAGFASDSLDVRTSVPASLPDSLRHLRHYSPSRHAALFEHPAGACGRAWQCAQSLRNRMTHCG